MIDVIIDKSVSLDTAGLTAARIQHAAEITLIANGYPLESSALTVVITNDEEITDLNRQYRRIDTATDVLSFAANERDPSSGVVYLGDVIISCERALDNLKDRLEKWQDVDLAGELLLLTVHGVLHLLGYDHAGAEEEARMWAQQERLLKELEGSA